MSSLISKTNDILLVTILWPFVLVFELLKDIWKSIYVYVIIVDKIGTSNESYTKEMGVHQASLLIIADMAEGKNEDD